MSDPFPTIRGRLDSFEGGFSRNIHFPEMNPALAERLGLEKLAELKRNWSVKSPSPQEIMSAVRKDILRKDILAKYPDTTPLSKEKLHERVAEVFAGIQLGHHEEVRPDTLNRVMWQSLKPYEQDAVKKAKGWVSLPDSKLEPSGEAEEADLPNAEREHNVLMKAVESEKIADKTPVSPEVAKGIVLGSLERTFPEDGAEELEEKYQEVVNQVLGFPEDETGSGEAINDYGKLRQALLLVEMSDDPFKEIVCNIRAALGDPVADALESLGDPDEIFLDDILVEYVARNPDGQALLEALKEKDFRVCLDLAFTCLKESGVLDENTNLSDYGLEDICQAQVREMAQNLQDLQKIPSGPVALEFDITDKDAEADPNKKRSLFGQNLGGQKKIVQNKLPALAERFKRKRIKNLRKRENASGSNGATGAQNKLKLADLKLIECKGVTFGKIYETFKQIDKFDEDFFLNPYDK